MRPSSDCIQNRGFDLPACASPLYAAGRDFPIQISKSRRRFQPSVPIDAGCSGEG